MQANSLFLPAVTTSDASMLDASSIGRLDAKRGRDNRGSVCNDSALPPACH
jgi:hypothetical protein